MLDEKHEPLSAKMSMSENVNVNYSVTSNLNINPENILSEKSILLVSQSIRDMSVGGGPQHARATRTCLRRPASPIHPWRAGESLSARSMPEFEIGSDVEGEDSNAA